MLNLKPKKKEQRTKKFVLSIITYLSLLLLLLFFSSCAGMIPKPGAVSYQTGTSGLDIKFLDQSPQSELYEGSSFIVGFMIENNGAFDVSQGNYAILSIGFDPFYVDASGVSAGGSRTGGAQTATNSVLFSGIQLNGKSEFYPAGQYSFLTFSGFKTREVIGQMEMPRTQILASLCYPYQTFFSGTVCVDLSIAGQSMRQEVCYEKDFQLSGQGAPVAITAINVENQPTSDTGTQVAVKPVYTIHVQNKGQGSVLSPVVGSANLERVCSLQDLTRQDFNTINIEATLSNIRLTCNPSTIKLYNNEGITRCEVNDESLFAGNHNFETTLTVKLSYVYQTSVSKSIAIRRLNPYGEQSTQTSGCLDFEVGSGSDCKIRCDVCATSGGSGCAPANAKYPVTVGPGWGCQCSDQTCNDLYPKGLCIPFPNYCPGVSYCCQPPCAGNEARLEDGKCYKKCSRCVLATVPGTTDCACGSGTDDKNYVRVAAGNFCCNIADKTQSFGTAQSCVDACKPATATPIATTATTTTTTSGAG